MFVLAGAPAACGHRGPSALVGFLWPTAARAPPAPQRRRCGAATPPCRAAKQARHFGGWPGHGGSVSLPACGARPFGAPQAGPGTVGRVPGRGVGKPPPRRARLPIGGRLLDRPPMEGVKVKGKGQGQGHKRPGLAPWAALGVQVSFFPPAAVPDASRYHWAAKVWPARPLVEYPVKRRWKTRWKTLFPPRFSTQRGFFVDTPGKNYQGSCPSHH